MTDVLSSTRLLGVSAGCLCVWGSWSAGPCQAAMLVHFRDEAGGVVMTGSGNLDIRSWPTPVPLSISTVHAGVTGSTALLTSGLVVGANNAVDAYYGIPMASGAVAFGGRGFLKADSTSGAPLAWALLSGVAYLPAGYASQQPLQTEMQWDRTTLRGMGLLPGRLTYAWSTPRGLDRLDLMVGPLPAPGPAPVLGLALALGLARRLRGQLRRGGHQAEGRHP